MSLTLWGFLIIVVGSVFLAIAVGVNHAATGTAMVVGIIPFAGYLMTLVGSWLLTVPDPSGLGEDRYGTARKIIRIALVIGIINQLIDWSNRFYGAVPPAVHLALATLGFAAGIVGVVGQFAELYYLEKLALRIPDFDLSQRARFLMWALGSSYAVFLVLGFAAALLGGPGGGLPALACVVLLVFLAVLVFAIMYLFTLGRFGQQFRDQAALARESWPSAQRLLPPDRTG